MSDDSGSSEVGMSVSVASSQKGWSWHTSGHCFGPKLQLSHCWCLCVGTRVSYARINPEPAGRFGRTSIAFELDVDV